MFLGANTLKCESSRERKFPGHFAPGSKSSREREGQGVTGPRSESSREQIGQDPMGRFAPRSELARERKGCESSVAGCRSVVLGVKDTSAIVPICLDSSTLVPNCLTDT